MLRSKFLTLSNKLLKKTKQGLYGHYYQKGFEAIHLNNTLLLPTRIDILNKLPKGSTIAEIGVDEGQFTEQILKLANPQKFEIIDAWDTNRYNVEKENAFKHKFESQLSKGSLEIHKGYSTEILTQFPDNYFDWVYLDTNHLYENTRNELRILSKKVKQNGIIAGHDYIVGNWNGGVRYGVVEAVRELCVEDHWQLIYVSSELDIPPSFAISRIH